jgi:hypothetical protein
MGALYTINQSLSIARLCGFSGRILRQQNPYYSLLWKDLGTFEVEILQEHAF